MATNPAYRIPLTDDQLKQLGETAAIISLIEKLMQNCVSYLLGVTGILAAQILGSTSTRTYSELWLALVEAKCRDRAMSILAAQATKDFGTLIELWNSFHHSTYAVDSSAAFPGTKGVIYTTHDVPQPKGAPIAIKVKTNTTHDPAKIPEMRELAAKLSNTVNQISESALRQSHEKPAP